MKENCLVYMCTQFQVDILKMAEFCYFESKKLPHFTLFPGTPVLSRYPSFVRYGHFQKCSVGIFRVLGEKLTKIMCHTTQKQNFKLNIFFAL